MSSQGDDAGLCFTGEPESSHQTGKVNGASVKELEAPPAQAWGFIESQEQVWSRRIPWGSIGRSGIWRHTQQY